MRAAASLLFGGRWPLAKAGARNPANRQIAAPPLAGARLSAHVARMNMRASLGVVRRKKQFAMIGPKTNDRAELGINLKDDAACARAVAQKPGGMCQFAVALTAPEQVDAEIASLLRRAYDAAG